MSQISYERYAASLSERELALELGYSERWPESSPLRRALLAERERREGRSD